MNAQGSWCNGTRLRILDFKDNVIQAEIIAGSHAKEIVFLPQIILKPFDQEYLFQIRRMQFLIGLAFSMTINKAQGQTLDFVGIYLFIYFSFQSRSILYVALSRGKQFEDIKIMVRDTGEQGNFPKMTWKRNVENHTPRILFKLSYLTTQNVHLKIPIRKTLIITSL